MNFEKINNVKENITKEGKFKSLIKYLKLAILAMISLATTEISAQKFDKNGDSTLINKNKLNIEKNNFSNKKYDNKTYKTNGYEKEASSISGENNDFDKEKFKQEALEYKDFGAFMACNLAFEKPNNYQIEQIKNLQNQIVEKVSNEKFDSVSQMIAFVNQSIDSNFSNAESTIYLKDAFPKKNNDQPIGTFDCDSRILMCLSILEKLGIPGNEVSFYLVKGHALLFIASENKFFEMTTNKIRELNKNESLELDKVDSFDKYLSYLLGKEATFLANEASGNILLNQGTNEEQMDVALDKARISCELDPNNITNNLNILNLLKRNDEKEKNKNLINKIIENIKMSLLNNYYHINNNLSNNITINNPEELSKKTPKSLKELGNIDELTIKALSDNDYLKEIFFKLGSDLYYDFNDFQISSNIFEELNKSYELKSNNINQPNSIEYYYSKTMLADSYFNSGEYSKYLSFFNKLYQSLTEGNQNEDNFIKNIKGELLSEQNMKATVSRLIIGEIKIDKNSIDSFCKEYKHDPLLSEFISGKLMWNSSAIDAVETLKKWEGYENMIKLINEWRENNK